MILLIAALIFFWLALSGKTDFFHLFCGALSVAFSAAVARLLWSRSPLLIWRRWPAFFAWLAREIVMSSFQVAYVVLHPKMPVSPQMVRFGCKLPHEWAQLSLAHSITLTPGTITVDVEGEEFLIHALTDFSASSASAESLLVRRVVRLFKEGSQAS